MKVRKKIENIKIKLTRDDARLLLIALKPGYYRLSAEDENRTKDFAQKLARNLFEIMK